MQPVEQQLLRMLLQSLTACIKRDDVIITWCLRNSVSANHSKARPPRWLGSLPAGAMLDIGWRAAPHWKEVGQAQVAGAVASTLG